MRSNTPGWVGSHSSRSARCSAASTPTPGLREHSRRNVEALQAPHQRRQRDPGEPGAAAEVEAPPLADRRAAAAAVRPRRAVRRRAARRPGPRGRRPDPRRTTRRTRRTGPAGRPPAPGFRNLFPAEGGPEKTRLRRERGARRGAHQRGLRRGDGLRRISGFPPGVGEGEPRLHRVRRERDGALQRLQGRTRVAEGGERLAEVAQGDGVVRPAPQGGAKKAHRVAELPRPRRARHRGSPGTPAPPVAARGRAPCGRALPEARRAAARRRRGGCARSRPRPGGRHTPVYALRRSQIAHGMAGHALSEKRGGILRRHGGTLGRSPLRSNLFTPHSRSRSCVSETLPPMIVIEPRRRHGDSRTWNGHAESKRAIVPGRSETAEGPPH